MSAAENLQELDDLIPLKKFSEATGITKKAVYEKIRIRTWREGYEFFKDPQGRIWVSRSGYQAWIKQGLTPAALNREITQFRSNSSSRVKLRIATKPFHGSPRQLT